MHRVHGVLALPEPTHFDGARVVVRLLDASYADAAARILGEANFEFSGDSKRIPFDIDTPNVAENLSISAEIRTKDQSRLNPGDWVTTRFVKVDPTQFNSQTTAEVPIERIAR